MSVIKSIKFILCTLFGGLLMSNCYASYEYPPNLSVLERYVFTIDNIEYSLDAPTGGNVGKHNVFRLESKDKKDQNHILFTISFDRFVSTNALYDLTRILFGLTKEGCCGVDSANKYEAASHNKTEKIEINGMEMLYVETTSSKNDYIAMFYLPYDEQYNMFFTLRIDNKLVKDKKLVELRLQMLKGIVSSLQRKEN